MDQIISGQDLLEKAKETPGVTEMIAFWEECAKVEQTYNQYLSFTSPFLINTNSNSSSDLY